MLVPCTQLVCIVNVKDGSNDYEASIVRTVSREYNIILQKIHQYSQTSTEWWEENKIP
jgi:hypothetical protein